MATESKKSALLRRQEVEARTGLARSSIYSKLDPNSRGYDESFPVPIRIGASSVRWHEGEVDAWIASRPRIRMPDCNDLQEARQ